MSYNIIGALGFEVPTVWSFAYAHTTMLKWWNDLFFIWLQSIRWIMTVVRLTSFFVNHWWKWSQYKACGISYFGTGLWAKAWTSIQKLLTWNLSAKSVICCFSKPALCRCLQKSLTGVFSYISSGVMKGQREFKYRLLRGQISTIFPYVFLCILYANSKIIMTANTVPYYTATAWVPTQK